MPNGTSTTPNWLTGFVGAVAGGIGVVGFTALVGGIVIWVPLHYAHLPANEALAVKPKAQLLTVGAAVLIPFVVGSLFIVFILSALHFAPPANWNLFSDFLPGLALFGLAVWLVVRFLPSFDSHKFAWIGLIGFALVGVATSYFVAVRFGSFLWFVIAVLLAVWVFGAAFGIVRTVATPKIQAAAVLRQGMDKGIRGYYVAETADRVYIARLDVRCPAEKASFARLIVIPRDNVIAMSIGPSKRPCEAKADSARLLNELKSDLKLKASAPRGNAGARRDAPLRDQVDATAASSTPVGVTLGPRDTMASQSEGRT